MNTAIIFATDQQFYYVLLNSYMVVVFSYTRVGFFYNKFLLPDSKQVESVWSYFS